MEEIIGERLKTPILSSIMKMMSAMLHRLMLNFNRLETIDKTLKLISGGEALDENADPS